MTSQSETSSPRQKNIFLLTMAANSVENHTENVTIEPLLAKRMRKDPDATTRKSVVVLKRGNVGLRDGMVFMPNTIEMAILKKPDKGQFKTNVHFSSNMTETDVKSILMENFPILRDRRFYCASVVDYRTRLEFHGERRIWDGRFIKKVIKGNSALYVFVEEDGNSGESEDSGYESSIREQSGTKRSFDQITTCGELTSSESPVKMSLSSMNGPAQPSPEKLPVVISTHDDPLENISSHSNLVSGLAEKSADQSDVELSNERPLMNVQQELVAPSNTILFLHNPLQQSLSMGGIPFIVFPTTGGIPVAPAPTAGNNALNTVPAQQSLEMPILPTSNNPGLQTALQASTLTPQLQSLHISSASSQQPQNMVTSEASLLGSSEALTTVDTTEISQQLSLTGAEGDRTDVEGGHQETENFKSPNQEEPNVEKTDSSQVPEKESEAIALARDQESSGLYTLQMFDLEPLPSEDSGFGTFEKSEENTSQDIHIAPVGAATRGDTYAKNVMLLKKEDLVQGNGKILMPTTIEMARMRKTGQYKKHVQFSKSMSEDAVRKTIQETFPAFDLSGRFSCASISNTDSTLQFHGDPRVWDGKTIRRILKGNSALYIVMEEIQNGLDMLMKVALAEKEREEGEKDSGFLSTRVPIEERMDVEMASDILETFPEQGLSELLSLEESSGKSEDILEIVPNRGPIEGGSPFILVFAQGLPPEVNSARADFGKKTVANLKRINAFNLSGKIPATDKPGKVTVTVYSSTGGILGKTDFDYYDQDKETLLRLVKDPKLQSEFFCHWADFMVDKTKRSEGQDLSQPSPGFSPPNQVLRLLVRIAANYTGQQLFELFFNSLAAGKAVFLAYKLMRRFSDENWDDQEFPPTVGWLVIGAEEAQRRLNHTDEIKETGYLSDEESSSSESSCSETFYSEDNSSTTSSEDHADEIKETGYLGDEESLSSKSPSSESSYSEDNSSTTSSEDHTDEIKETEYEGDEESSSCKSSSSKTPHSEEKSSTTSSEDQNPTSEECCGPVTVAKYGRKNEAEEVSLMKACMEFVGQDLSRLEPKPKVNDQERGGSSSEKDFSPGEHKREVARESRRQNIQQRNPVFNLNFDQNSIAEKTRRAKERSDEEETGDLNGAPL